MLDIRNIPEDQISAVHALEGKTLTTGWTVLSKVKSKPGSTGSNFSVCYIVQKNNQVGFLKAINTLSFLNADVDLLKATREMLNTYDFEKEILSRCKSKNLSRVSQLLEAGFENFPGYLVANVYYLIFEKADGDVRNHINFSSIIDDAWKLKSLHNIATGLKQLHGIEISHQDIKPSNVFVFENGVSKVGDLGRALSQSVVSPHSNKDFAGDPRYAPPEVYHGYVLPSWKDKVYAIDCYMLGSMATYYFTGQSMIALLSQNIDPSINILTLDFEHALPYWIEAYDQAILVLKNHTTNIDGQDRLLDAVRMLCYPDPKNRGHINNRNQIGNNFQLERFVEIFNLLARKAEHKLTK